MIHKKKYCRCCKKELKSYFSTQKYCNNCSIYTKNKRTKISTLKNKIKKLEQKIYLTENPEILKFNIKRFNHLKELINKYQNCLNDKEKEKLKKFLILNKNSEEKENA